MQNQIGRREQKRQRILDTVHQKAIALFAKYGYDAVTVEKIAEAADISRSTFFRHFATKEATVLHNSLNPALLDEFRNQPSDITTIQALRNTVHEVFSRSSPTIGEDELHEQRYNLIRTVPQVQAAMLQELSKTIIMLAEVIAERTERMPTDPEVYILASALIGIVVGIVLDTSSTENYLARLDQALEQLEVGFAI